MKKILLASISLILSGFLYSQSLQMIYSGHPISNDDTIFSAVMDTNGFASEIIDIKNLSSNTINVKVEKFVCNAVPGSDNFFCWTQCYPSTTYIAPDSVNFVPEFIFTGFSSDYTPLGHSGVTLMRYKFFDIANLMDTISVFVQFNAVVNMSVAENSVNKASFSNSYPNPANSYTKFNYNLPSTTNSAKFVLRNLLGATVKEYQINDLQGTVNVGTNDLKSGVYFYSFIVDDKIISTKKLVVNH
ncbi:MAG: T9SS type A sorting domain-containing protein [Bacteroidetes bacterium]|nr:T9SS type A sorting domain-containing protein [Bacteroidota bacterium]